MVDEIDLGVGYGGLYLVIFNGMDLCLKYECIDYCMGILLFFVEVLVDEWNVLFVCDVQFMLFLCYEFFDVLYVVCCVVDDIGWLLYFVMLIDVGIGCFVVVVFVYVKQYLYGEYVFDWVWVDVYQCNDLFYYLKLLCVVLFMLVQGMWLFVVDDDVCCWFVVMLFVFVEQSDVLLLYVLFLIGDEVWLFELMGMMLCEGV